MSWVAVAIGGSALLGYAASGNAASKQSDAAGKASQVQSEMFGQTQQNLEPYREVGQGALVSLADFAGVPGPRVDGNGGYWSRPGPSPSIGGGGKAPAPFWVSDGSGGPQSARHGMLTKPFGLEDFQASPAYNFNLEQGQMAIDKAAAARHNFYSPATLQQIAKYSQGLASNEFQNAYSNYNTNLKNVWDRLYALSGTGQNASAQLGGFGTTVGGQIGENTIGAGNAAAAGQIGQANAISGGVGSYYNTNMLSQYLANQQAPTYPSGTKSSGQVAPDFMNS